ncbi:sigma-54-dependent transcriptional regulator [Pseudobacteriovorax antillogorgiicola]|uniref:DNA-binding transcriptional response regulator, NtrC family, contains REC, AAA-type ATPase, and a Fis-type DNA-binding domains n=1 Tax=Pseudobacteriovorax antillogorgiicola TaxID=1513793 RepID=A0A1Y6BRX9_9BACT|nr:sigma 54-interacting transcriptional regulator [Pseudobacteriovorax antillogorgiicola]TCS54590.1 DNA-binding NtrC family response regulator [Pseudobacteriovorax antillogorgiicola]SMF17759.1 DNA-binding transcriptional response regulator, NtrC family, contains REC, AAA-type ATPase, and a Fis-type DNA-binding domains [Pseudobacteriovorax antillogorgiicola]
MAINRIYHLDDDPFYGEEFRETLTKAKGHSFQVTTCLTAEELFAAIDEETGPCLIVLDINIGQSSVSGDRLVQKLKQEIPRAIIMMCSDMNDPETVRRCLDLGADDFIFKGLDEGDLVERLAATFAFFQTDRNKDHKPKHFVSSTLDQIKARIPRIINSAISSVHIFGESGTGKELVSELFEEALPSGVPFNRIHCGAIAPTLLESELFGHVKGAFTGASANKVGLIEQANGGWIFLDEVATLTSSAQVALLRVLDNQTIRPVGAAKEKPVAIRILSATNESLPELVEQGRFRMDLWQRLCEATIELAPLRDRMDEFDALVQHFCKTMTLGPFHISAGALDILKRYTWRHGNIRELRNCLRAMTEGAMNKILAPAAIPKHIWESIGEQGRPQRQDDNTIVIPLHSGEHQDYEQLSQILLVELIRVIFSQKGAMSIRQLSQAIAIPRSTLGNRLHKLVQEGHIEDAELKTILKM